MDNCRQCGKPVFTRNWDGSPDDYCERCAQALIDRSNESREWDHSHPGEPIPASELTPLPQKSVNRANEKDSQ